MENNKLIAEFMNHYENMGNLGLQYHSDWNWLMEVVERIENLGFEFFIVESRCAIAHNTDQSIETIIDFEIMGNKREAIYNAVVEFIKWYNENNK
jgi:hypothetical protein